MYPYVHAQTLSAHLLFIRIYYKKGGSSAFTDDRAGVELSFRYLGRKT